ncbi:MAG: hypothetical protein J6C41_09030 [Oscillospiraceae bacterium]|nr:hypothetical protein [Oscillospiraceae bacterium]
MNNPCKNCTRVQNPADCENKQCRVWQQWFLGRWEDIHGYYQKHQQEEKEKKDELETGSH